MPEQSFTFRVDVSERVVEFDDSVSVEAQRDILTEELLDTKAHRNQLMETLSLFVQQLVESDNVKLEERVIVSRLKAAMVEAGMDVEGIGRAL